MPQLPNESEAEYLDRLCAMGEDAAEEELDEAEADVRKQERKQRKEEKKEAERRAKEAEEEAARKAREEEAARKAREEEAARKAKEEEKKRKKAEKAERAAKAAAKPASKTSVASGSGGIGSQASGSGGKAKGKAKATQKALDIDEDEDEEAPAEKKAKRDPCVRCAKMNIPCAVQGSSERRSRRACEACHAHKVRCEWGADADGSSGPSVVTAVQDLTESNEAGFMDLFTSMREANGTLNNLLKVGVAFLQLNHGDAGVAAAKKITDSRERKKAQWLKEDAQEDK
ncbi:hypothetical protein DFH08DRAFT_972913, partial [Mycena albidolilacea]